MNDNSKMIYYNTDVNFTGNLDLELIGSKYSDETEIASGYINNTFKSTGELLETYNKLIQAANSYLSVNKEIESLNIPSFAEINFSVDLKGLIPQRNALVITKESGSTVNIRSGPGTSFSPIGQTTGGSSIIILGNPDLSDKEAWTMVKYGNNQGYMKNIYLQ